MEFTVPSSVLGSLRGSSAQAARRTFKMQKDDRQTGNLWRGVRPEIPEAPCVDEIWDLAGARGGAVAQL